MKRLFRPTAVLGAFLLVISALAPVVADSPATEVPHAIGVVDANGFVAVSETTTPEGAVVDTFVSGDITVRVIGTRGASISFYPGGPTETQRGSLGVLMNTVRPKTEKDATRYRDSGRTVVGDLIALGVPREQAELNFGDMETMDGTNPYLQASATQEDADATLASATAPVQKAAAPAASASTPYDTQCITASAEGGKLYGYGCSTFFLVSAVGTDWWFNNKFKFSAHSTDTSLFPKRLKQVGWKIQWSSGNVVYDWEPASTTPIGSCYTVSLSATWKAFSISVSAQICPNSHGPWEVASTKSGARWQGAEHDTDWEAAIGLQAVHNPPGVATSYSSYAMWVY